MEIGLTQNVGEAGCSFEIGVNNVKYVVINFKLQIQKQIASVASVEAINHYRMQKANHWKPEHRFERWT